MSAPVMRSARVDVLPARSTLALEFDPSLPATVVEP